MFPALQRSVASTARRVLPTSIKQAGKPLAQTPPSFLQPHQRLLRPFSVLGTCRQAWNNPALSKVAEKALAPGASKVGKSALDVATPSALASTPPTTAAPAVVAEGVMDSLRSKGMVFEIGISFVFLHYQSIFIGVMRCLFQSFRPLLILFVFGQILKAVFFVAGAPIWLSFYSIWLFEVIYGLAQCAISFIFISFFYNNLSMARLRPALSYVMRQQREKLSRAARLM